MPDDRAFPGEDPAVEAWVSPVAIPAPFRSRRPTLRPEPLPLPSSPDVPRRPGRAHGRGSRVRDEPSPCSAIARLMAGCPPPAIPALSASVARGVSIGVSAARCRFPLCRLPARNHAVRRNALCQHPVRIGGEIDRPPVDVVAPDAGGAAHRRAADGDRDHRGLSWGAQPCGV